MDLLLQAAKVLESENSGIGNDGSNAVRSTRGSHGYGSPKGKDSKVDRNRTLSSSSIVLEDNADEDLSLAGERRRAGGAGTREVHNQLEKNRRKQMRECFNQLQQCIPSLENKRVATHSILQGAIKHIKSLKKKDVEQEREIQMLAKRKSELKKKYDIEFNKCSAEQQRKAAEVRMKLDRAENRETFDDIDDGNASDSTSTASEGPGNEENFSDEEKAESREKPQVSRVNPVVAAKLDGFRKRKLATLDPHPKSTDYIITSMRDAAYLPPSSSKQKPAPLSSVSSSSVALKNMLEQKKRQQSGFSPSLGQQSILEQTNPKVVSATTKFSSSKGISSLTSSHPMISNQLAAATSIPLAMPSASVLVNPVESTDRIAQVPNSAISNFSPLKNKTPGVLSLTSLQNKIRIVESNKSPQPVLFSANSGNSIYSAVPAKTAEVGDGASPQLPTRTRSSSITLTSEAADNNLRVQTSFPTASKSPPVVGRPVNVFIENANPILKGSNALPSTLPNHSTSSPAVPIPPSVTPASNKVVPAVFPLSLIQGLALSPSVAPVTVTSVVPPSNSGVSSTSAIPLISAVSPILQPKIHPSEILIASPVKTEPVPSGTNPSTGRVTTLLTATTQANTGVIKPNPTFVGTLPISNMSSSVTSASIATPTATMALPETLKTMAMTPAILPFTVTAGPLPASSTSISHGAPLRFFTPINPSSVVTAPLTNGQTSLMPAVVQLDGSAQLTVLQNFVQLQSSQMLGQPIVVVTTPSSMIAPVTSVAAAANVPQTSSSSGSLL